MKRLQTEQPCSGEKGLEMQQTDIRENEETGSVNKANFIKWNILRAMKSPYPDEGREYCRKLYQEVKGGHCGGDERETGWQFISKKVMDR